MLKSFISISENLEISSTVDLLKSFVSVSENFEISSAFDFFDSDIDPNLEVLSPKESEICSRFTSRKRQNEFVAGRIACKKAFFKLTSRNKNCFEKFPSVSVLNAETGAPFIENSDLFVSVSHSHGAAIASVSRYAVGVDIEQISPKRVSALKKMSGESFAESQDVTGLTALWALKESLGKALRTGIVEEFRHYDTENFRCENGFFRCDFKNFPSFSGIAVTDGKYAAAIVTSSSNFATEQI